MLITGNYFFDLLRGMYGHKYYFYFRLVQEVCELQDNISVLREKLSQAESTHQALLSVRASLEADLRNKVSTLFIDRDQCGGIRRGYPVTAAIKY